MKDAAVPCGDYLRSVLDAVPSPMFVIDAGLCIRDANRAAAVEMSGTGGLVDRKLCGEVLHCANVARSPGGCGTAPACRQCVVRNSVDKVLKSGSAAVRERATLEIVRGGAVSRVESLITVSLFRHQDEALALVIIEDITDVVELAKLIPICSACKKIRNDQSYWESVDAYLTKHARLRFTHGICPDCAAKLYRE